MLKKKNIIVTGSSRGLGLAIAKELIAQNHKVVLNGRNQQPFLKLKQRNKNINYIIGDFSNPTQSDKLIKNACKILGRIDVLICNIGESKSCLPNHEHYNEWKKMFHQNFFSASNAVESSKKNLIKSKGSIIFISSICGNEFIKGAPITYSTAKAALNFYAKSLSHYLGQRGVNVNLISPGNLLFKGSTWENKIKKNKNKVKKLIKETVPTNVFGTVDDITRLVNYLVSSKSKFINGSIFTVDGGQTIKL